jgi:hypothetical protein
MFLDKANQPPYWVPTKRYLMANQLFMERSLGIDVFFDKVHPDNRNAYLDVPVSKSSNSNSSITRGYPIFIYIVEMGNHKLNTTDGRKALGENLAKFINHPESRKGYTYFTEAVYGGDLASSTITNRPYLSEYATDDDTMNVIRKALGGTTDDNSAMASIEEVMNTPEAMADYFHPDHLEAAKQRFIGYGYSAAGKPDPTNGDEPDFSEFGAFQV